MGNYSSRRCHPGLDPGSFPVADFLERTTREMKVKFRELQSRMQDPAQQQDYSKTSSASTEASSKVSKEDYIDFEEIK